MLEIQKRMGKTINKETIRETKVKYKTRKGEKNMKYQMYANTLQNTKGGTTCRVPAGKRGVISCSHMY